MAAAELGLTQTAVSKQVAALERDLGTALFDRRNRAVFLTEEGRRFGRIVSAALADIATEAAHLRGADLPGGLVLHCQLCEAFTGSCRDSPAFTNSIRTSRFGSSAHLRR
nr:LysR family transcriptional regulator [Chelativorans sp. YIM 93263]